MRTYTEKPRTEVDWKGFAYDPFLDGSSRISVGLVATRMLMCRITELGVPVAAEPLNALTPQYVNGLVTYNGVGARNVTDQTARERVSGFSSVVGFKNSPEGSIDAAIQAVVTARAPHEFLGVDHHGVSAQLSTTGNDTGHVILRGDKDGPNYSAAHIADTKRKLAARGLPEVVVVDASHGNSQKNHLRQIDVVRDLAGQIAGGERAIRGVMVESNLVAGRQDLDRRHPEVAGVRQERHRRLRRPRRRPRRCWPSSPRPPGRGGTACRVLAPGWSEYRRHLAGPRLRRRRRRGWPPASWSSGSGLAGSGGRRWRAASGFPTSVRATSCGSGSATTRTSGTSSGGDTSPSSTTHPEVWQPLADAAADGDITLLYSSRDTEHNNAVALREYLLARQRRRPAGPFTGASYSSQTRRRAVPGADAGHRLHPPSLVLGRVVLDDGDLRLPHRGLRGDTPRGSRGGPAVRR